MSDRGRYERPHEPNTDHAAVTRDPQVLDADELIVYEAVATLRRPLGTDELTATTGLDERTVRSAVEHLTDLDMVIAGEHGTSIGPNDWDVRGNTQAS